MTQRDTILRECRGCGELWDDSGPQLCPECDEYTSQIPGDFSRKSLKERIFRPEPAGKAG